MSLNNKQTLAVQKIFEGKNVFISGPGGVGKSYLINHLRDKFSESMVLLSPTGIAALNIGGATIHSVFKLPFGILTQKDYEHYNQKTAELFKGDTIKRIIIDEISMVRSDVFETIDQQLRRIKRKNVPFGGIQIIVVGDFFQLPPVTTSNEETNFNKFYDSPFAFGSKAWSACDFEYIELDEVMRQSDQLFISNLMKIRTKAPDFKSAVDFFNNFRVTKQTLENDPLFLCTVNRTADSINQINYDSIDGQQKTFYAKQSGIFKEEPAPRELKLKVGTKVMMIANTESFKNGEIGYVAEMTKDRIIVILESNEATVTVEQYEWKMIDYYVADGKLYRSEIGSYKQFPMKYAYAVTIHKCQGQTLSDGVIDLGWGCFASGQLYVALSRLKTLDGLSLNKPIKEKDVIVDKRITEFYNNGCKGIGLW